MEPEQSSILFKYDHIRMRIKENIFYQNKNLLRSYRCLFYQDLNVHVLICSFNISPKSLDNTEYEIYYP